MINARSWDARRGKVRTAQSKSDAAACEHNWEEKKARLLLSHTFIKEDNEAAARADASF